MTGWPSVNVPAGLTAGGLPIGAQLLGPANSESQLIALAAQLETVERWHERRPPVSVPGEIRHDPDPHDRGGPRLMPTVREATFDLFRAHGMTTIFGNPGSTELPMLADFPDDFRYVLGLQELVVVGMADGYAQATGRPTHVNLHTAPGVGNAVGGIFNAQANKSPLVITAGQQVRAADHDRGEPHQPRRRRRAAAVRQVEPRAARAQDVPGAIGRAIHHAIAAAARARVRVDPDGRLGRRGRRGPRAQRDRPVGHRPHGARPRRARAGSRAG